MPPKSVTGNSCPLNEKQVQALSNFADRRGVTSLYYRVRAEDIEKGFVTYSEPKITNVP